MQVLSIFRKFSGSGTKMNFWCILYRFRESMEEVERRYQCVMVAAVQTVEAVAQGLKVLNAFKPLAARKSLFSVFYVMIDHVSTRHSD